MIQQSVLLKRSISLALVFLFVLTLLPISGNLAYGRDCSTLQADYNAAVIAEADASKAASKAYSDAFEAAAIAFTVTIFVTVYDSKGVALLVPKKVITTAGIAAAVTIAWKSQSVIDAYAELSNAASVRQQAWTALDNCKNRHDCGCRNTTTVIIRSHLDGCSCPDGKAGQCPCEVPASSS